MRRLRLVLPLALLTAMFGQQYPPTPHPGEGKSKPQNMLCSCGDVLVRKNGKYYCQGCGEIYSHPPGKK
jgi:hypothetical protein